MPLYVSYVSMTTEGAKELKEAPERIADVARWIQEAGGKIIAAYTTMGQYDYLYITEFPNDMAGWPVLAKSALAGVARTETVPAIPLGDWMEIVGKA